MLAIEMLVGLASIAGTDKALSVACRALGSVISKKSGGSQAACSGKCEGNSAASDGASVRSNRSRKRLRIDGDESFLDSSQIGLRRGQAFDFSFTAIGVPQF